VRETQQSQSLECMRDEGIDPGRQMVRESEKEREFCARVHSELFRGHTQRDMVTHKEMLYPPIYLLINICAHVSIKILYLSIHLPIYLSVCLSVCLSV